MGFEPRRVFVFQDGCSCKTAWHLDKKLSQGSCIQHVVPMGNSVLVITDGLVCVPVNGSAYEEGKPVTLSN